VIKYQSNQLQFILPRSVAKQQVMMAVFCSPKFGASHCMFFNADAMAVFPFTSPETLEELSHQWYVRDKMNPDLAKCD
jgi:hypothetical protein